MFETALKEKKEKLKKTEKNEKLDYLKTTWLE